MYWHESSSFYDASCGLLKAAVDLGFDILPFRKAFKDVGIDYCTSVSTILQNNETLNGIIVSDKITPDFMMETPRLAETLIIDVKSNTSNDIIIDVTVQDENYEHLINTQAANRVEIPDSANKVFYIKLSLSNDKPSDDCDEMEDNNIYGGVAEVSITAGFMCKINRYESSDVDDSNDVSFSGSGDDDNTHDDDSSFSGSGDDDNASYDDDGSFFGSGDNDDYDSNDFDDYYNVNRNRRNRRSGNIVATC
jgi:hypothetical protein